MEENKKITEMTEKEILRQQLLILAERSLTADEDELLGLTHAMLAAYNRLHVDSNYIPCHSSEVMKEPVEIKVHRDRWQDVREVGVEIENESVVRDVIKILLKSDLSYSEANGVLYEADRVLRCKVLTFTKLATTEKDQ